jgi:DnaA family protein
MIIAANAAPSAVGFELPDLVSRLTWGTVFQLANRSDEDLGNIIQFRLENRGLETTSESIKFLLTRVDRDLGNLMMIVNELDKKSLQAKRKLTIPFMKQALGL